MIELNDRIDQNIKNFMKTLPSEDIYFEAVREIIKDILKEYIKKRINEDPDLKSGIAEVLKEFIAAKLKEYDSMARMARITAKIGVQIAPESIKDEAMEDFVSVFQKEIEEIIKKTL
jgi:signal recognition particle GTPase